MSFKLLEADRSWSSAMQPLGLCIVICANAIVGTPNLIPELGTAAPRFPCAASESCTRLHVICVDQFGETMDWQKEVGTAMCMLPYRMRPSTGTVASHVPSAALASSC